MRVNIEILAAEYISSLQRCETLQEKHLVKNMMLRRRLTRSAKIALYLASKTGYSNEKIIFGTAYGEVDSTINVLHSVYHKTALSPTAFQNSVHNTPVSYLSIVSKNDAELTVVSDLFDTSLSVLKTGAIKALGSRRVLLLNIDAIFFEGIEEMNHCGIEKMEAGVGLMVRVTDKEPTAVLENKSYKEISPSLWQMVELYEKFAKEENLIFEVEI